jgi:hypothetical protein
MSKRFKFALAGAALVAITVIGLVKYSGSRTQDVTEENLNRI